MEGHIDSLFPKAFSSLSLGIVLQLLPSEFCADGSVADGFGGIADSSQRNAIACDVAQFAHGLL